MSNTNTNTNTNHGQNGNKKSGRGGRGQGSPSSKNPSDCRNNWRNKKIAKYVFKGEMKDGPISKLLITKSGHRPTQFKKITDTFPVLCTDKNFRRLDEVLWTSIDLVETNFMPTYPGATRWSNTHHVEIQTVTSTATIDAATGVRPPITVGAQKIHVFDANF